MTYEAYAHGIFNTEALGDPIEALPNQDLPLLLYLVGEPVSQFYAVLDGHLFHVAEFVLLFLGRVLRWWFSLLVRWCPPLASNS